MSESSYDLDLLDVVYPGVGVVTLNKPDRLNAWSAAMSAAFFARLDEARANDDIRVVVVTGSGRGFCPGADMDALNTIRANPAGGAGAATGVGRFSDMLSYPKPVIAAINGAVAGVGLVMALFCDLRFAASGVKFTTAFSRRGLIAEYGSSWMLPRLIGNARALDLLLSGRVFTSEEAERLGVVNGVVDGEQLMPHVLAYAQDLADNCCPTSWAVMKKQVYGDWENDADTATGTAIRLMNESLMRDDFQEGVQSYLDKRAPRFQPVRD
ncbi:MAG: enoyl-CoA hydratase-related protein [Ilumatobacteraceae bacterium]